MSDLFVEVRRQIHEIRSFILPLDIKLETLMHEITKSRISFELKTSQLDSQIEENSSVIARHSEEINRIKLFINMPQDKQDGLPSPVREDKLNSVIIPPQTPPA